MAVERNVFKSHFHDRQPHLCVNSNGPVIQGQFTYTFMETAVKFIPHMLALAGSFAMLSCSAHADTLPIITITSTGTIAEGTDAANYFHAGTSLIGQQFSMSLTIDPNTLPIVETGPERSMYQNYTDTAVSWGALTINGLSYSWRNDQSSSYVVKRNPADRGHEASIDAYGIANDGMSVYASTDIRSDYNRFLQSNDITQDVVFDMKGLYMLGETYVSVHPVSGDARGFVLRGTELASAAWTVSPVPEPGEYAMLAAGLVLAGLARRWAGPGERPQRRTSA
jgi:hypothetical protein